MIIKDAFEPFFTWQEKMGMSLKTIENDGTILKARSPIRSRTSKS